MKKDNLFMVIFYALFPLKANSLEGFIALINKNRSHTVKITCEQKNVHDPFSNLFKWEAYDVLCRASSENDERPILFTEGITTLNQAWIRAEEIAKRLQEDLPSTVEIQLIPFENPAHA